MSQFHLGVSRTLNRSVTFIITLGLLASSISAYGDNPSSGGAYQNTPRNQTTAPNNNGTVQFSAPNNRVSGTATTTGVQSSQNTYVTNSTNPVNTVNNGRIVNGGTYYNTADSKTTFTNTGAGGLWVRDNANLRGLEVNAAGATTNNGGTFHFYAPNSVVRVDGNINVDALRNGQGTYMGNGGKVFVDAAYYYQSGHISAGGFNGGLVQLNVGSMTLQPGASIQAKGFGGNGGVIAVNSDGAVQLKPNTLLDTSGKVAGTFDTNVINIEGGVVRAAGIMRANGAVIGSAEGSRGGTVRLVATGNTNLTQVEQALADATTPGTVQGELSPTFSNSERNTLQAELHDTVSRFDGDIHISGTFNPQDNTQVTPALISVNGTSGAVAANNDTVQENTLRAGDGGTVILSAMGDVQNLGRIQANGGHGASGNNPVRGGNGGTIVATAGERVNNDLFTYTTRNNGLIGQIQADGGTGGTGGSAQFGGAVGGKGGLIAFNHKTGMVNKGDIVARGGQGGNGASNGGTMLSSGGHGGQGGLIVISGTGNPTNGGSLKADGGNGGNGHNVTAPQAQGGVAGVVVSPNPQGLSQTQFVSQKSGDLGLNNGTSRGTGIQRAITAQTANNELLGNAENLILLTRGGTATRLDDRIMNATVRTVINPLNNNAASEQIAIKDDFGSNRPFRNFVVGSNANQLSLLMNSQPVGYVNGGAGEINLLQLNTLTVLNDGLLTNTHEWVAGSNQSLGGGRISLLANGPIQNGMGFFTRGNVSAGSINLASKTAIENYDVLTTQIGASTNNIHGGSIQLNSLGNITNFGYRSVANEGSLIGGTQRWNANGNLLNLGDIHASARNETVNVPATGGNVQLRSGGFMQHGNEEYTPVFVYVSAMGGNSGQGGNIRMQGASVNTVNADLNVSGSQQNGQIVISP